MLSVLMDCRMIQKYVDLLEFSFDNKKDQSSTNLFVDLFVFENNNFIRK